MRLIEKLMAKRDAAFAEYTKWNQLIEVMQNDPEFASIVHYGATKTMATVAKLATEAGALNGKRTQHTPDGIARIVKATKAAWTPERRAKQSRLMKKLAKQGRNPAQWAKGRTVSDDERAKVSTNNGARKMSAEQRKALSDRMKRLRADPAFNAKRLANLSAKLKGKPRPQRKDANV